MNENLVLVEKVWSVTHPALYFAPNEVWINEVLKTIMNNEEAKKYYQRSVTIHERIRIEKNRRGC